MHVESNARSKRHGMQGEIFLRIFPVKRLHSKRVELLFRYTNELVLVKDRRLEASAAADLVIGSRYVTGGRVENWPRRRILMSGFGVGLSWATMVIETTNSTKATK